MQALFVSEERQTAGMQTKAFAYALRGLRLVVAVGYAVLWAGGVWSFTVRSGPSAGFGWTGPTFVAMAGALMLAYVPIRYAVALLAAGATGFVVEVLGVATAFPFGDYTYTHAFGPKLLHVPVVLASAWLILAGYTHGFVSACRSRWLRVAMGAAILVVIDLMLDPVAVRVMNLWEWSEPGGYYGIPLTNFLGWFVAGLVVMLVLDVLGSPHPEWAPYWLGSSVIAFYGVASLSAGLTYPFLISVGLCAARTWALVAGLRDNRDAITSK